MQVPDKVISCTSVHNIMFSYIFHPANTAWRDEAAAIGQIVTS